MENEKINLKGIYFFYFLSLLVLPLGFLIRLLYSRTISVEEFGIIYALINFFGFLSIFSNLGLSSSLRYFIPKFRVKKDYKSIKNIVYYSFITHILLIIFFSIIIYLSSGWLSVNYFHNSNIDVFLKIFLIYFVFLNLFTSVADVFISYRLNVYYQSIYFLELLSTLIISFILYYYGFTNLALLYSFSWGLGCLIAFLLYVIFLFIKFPYFLSLPNWDKSLFKEHFSYSLYMFVSGIGTVILLQTDILIITYFLSLKSVAYYSNASALINIFVSFFASIAIIFMPLFSELKEKKDLALLNRILNILYGIIFYIITPISLLFFLFPNRFLLLIYGKEYIIGSGILAFFSIFSIFKIFLSYNFAFMNGLGLAKKLPKLILPVAFLNLLLNFILIKPFGLIGVAFSTVLGWILLVFFTFKYIAKEINFKFDIRVFIKIPFLGFVFVVVVLLLKKITFVFDFYVSSFIVLTISFFIYLVLGYLMKVYTIEELYIFIPSKTFKTKLRKIHKKYFNLLK